MKQDVLFDGFEPANTTPVPDVFYAEWYDATCWQCQQPTSPRSRNKVTGLCGQCDHHLLSVVVRNKKRARVKGNEATLTSSQWATILQSSKGLCTYCHTFIGYRDLVLEHKVPVGKGGGTTAENCVPACQKCNWEKMGSGKGGTK